MCVCLSLSLIPLPSSQPSLCGSPAPLLLLLFLLHLLLPLLLSLPPSLLLCGVCPLCAYCRLALDDAIRHKQLNISRFSPRVAGENDFLQTVINKVITAKEVNHKGQGTVQGSDTRTKEGTQGSRYCTCFLHAWCVKDISCVFFFSYFNWLFFKGAVYRKWPPLTFILHTNTGRHVTIVATNWSSV